MYLQINKTLRQALLREEASWPLASREEVGGSARERYWNLEERLEVLRIFERFEWLEIFEKLERLECLEVLEKRNGFEGSVQQFSWKE